MTPEIAADHALLDLIAAHSPADREEASDQARIEALVRETDTPRSRDQFTPGHLTASAVVVDAERERALLIFHHKLQRWLQPGGHFEPGEGQPLEVAQREVLEETGLHTQVPSDRAALLDVDVHQIPARKSEPAHEHFDLRFLLVAQAGEAFAGDGAERIRWVGPADLEPLGLDPGLRRALRKVWPAS